MKKRVTFYADRKNPLVWLSAILMAGSAALRIANFCGKGADATTVWLELVLPAAACLMFALILLVSGKERLYRTAVPVFLLAAFFAVTVLRANAQPWVKWLACILLFAYFLFYDFAISGKCGKSILPLVVLLFIPSVYSVYFAVADYLAGGASALLLKLPDLLMLLGGLAAALAARRHRDGAYHPTWGDRPDGRKLRSLDPVQIVGNYIMPNRVPAANQIRDSLDLATVEHYIQQKRKQGLAGFGITHVILAAHVRTLAKYPALNRFISGQQVYTRDEDIQFCMMVKEEMTLEGAESAMKLHLSPHDTADDVYHKMKAEVERIKGASEASSFDKVAKLLSLIPGVVFKFTVWLLKTMDYFGLLPKFLLEVSPFHGSVFFTSMGSLGIPPVTHHLYDFGNLPIFIAFGCKYRKNELEADGTVVPKRYVDYTVNTDERICDGFYYASALKYFKRLMLRPEQLDEAPEQVVRDID